MSISDDMSADLSGVFFSDFSESKLPKIDGVKIESGHLDISGARFYDIEFDQKMFSFPAEGAPPLSRASVLVYGGESYSYVRHWTEDGLIKMVVV